MKRKDLIIKLVKEGITEKTLVNMSDKQLGLLAKRLLPEQVTSTVPVTSSTSNSSPVATIPLNSLKSNPEQARKMANAGIKFTAAESEIKEDEKKSGATWGDVFKAMDLLKDARDKGHITQKEFDSAFKKLPKKKKPAAKKKDTNESALGGGTSKKDKKEDDKKTIVDRLYHKIQSCIKSGKKYDDYTRLVKEINNGTLPEKIASLIKKPKPSLQEWVNKVVEKNHPSTSKGEIMELLQIKLNEQFNDVEDSDVTTMDRPKEGSAGESFEDVLSYDKLKELSGSEELVPGLSDFLQSIGIGSTQTEPEVQPGTEPDVLPGEPDTRPQAPPNPFNPGPGIDPGPKASAGSPATQPAEPDVLPDTHPGEPDIKPKAPPNPFNPGPGIDPGPKAKGKQKIR